MAGRSYARVRQLVLGIHIGLNVLLEFLWSQSVLLIKPFLDRGELGRLRRRLRQHAIVPHHRSRVRLNARIPPDLTGKIRIRALLQLTDRFAVL